MSVPSMVMVDFSVYFVVDDEIVLLPSDRRVDRVGMEYAWLTDMAVASTSNDRALLVEIILDYCCRIYY